MSTDLTLHQVGVFFTRDTAETPWVERNVWPKGLTRARIQREGSEPFGNYPFTQAYKIVKDAVDAGQVRGLFYAVLPTSEAPPEAKDRLKKIKAVDSERKALLEEPDESAEAQTDAYEPDVHEQEPPPKAARVPRLPRVAKAPKPPKAAPAPKPPKVVDTTDLPALYEIAKAAMKDQTRTHCKNNHEISLANANPADLRRLKKYYCLECIRNYAKK